MSNLPISGSPTFISMLAGKVSASDTVLRSSLPSDNFIQDAGPAVVNRVNDRMLVGNAAVNDAKYPNIVWDWLTEFERNVGARSNGTMVSAQVGILNNDYFGAGVGLLTGVRTLNFISAATGASGHSSIAVNNNATLATSAWAFYGEAHRANDVVGSAIGMELDTSNFGTYHPITPYAQDAKMTVTLQLAAGSEYPGGSQDDASAAINIRDNPKKFGVGIVFGANSIRGTDGVTGDGSAIGLATRHKISWYLANGSEAAFIQSKATASTARIVFDDLGLLLLGPTDNVGIIMRPTSNIANYFDFTPGVASAPPVLAMSGTDTNIDFQINTKGTGLIRLGNANNMNANGTTATVLGSVGPAGANTTVQEWLCIRNSAGVQRYIPCF